jgi:hypothetical protein
MALPLPRAPRVSMLRAFRAGVAQPVERRICNPQVKGSSPLASSPSRASALAGARATGGRVVGGCPAGRRAGEPVRRRPGAAIRRAVVTIRDLGSISRRDESGAGEVRRRLPGAAVTLGTVRAAFLSCDAWPQGGGRRRRGGRRSVSCSRRGSRREVRAVRRNRRSHVPFRENAGGGEVPKRPNGADCKSAGSCLRRFESSPLHHAIGLAASGLADGPGAGVRWVEGKIGGNSSVG